MTKEPTQAVYMRIKQANHDWLKVQAEKEERPVTWIVNKMIEHARKAEDAKHEKKAASTLISIPNQHSQNGAQ